MITIRKACPQALPGRPVIKIPPDRAIQDLPALGWNEQPTYPAIMVQLKWGVQAYWSDEDGIFTIQKRNSVIQDSSGPLIQIRVNGIEFALGRMELAWGWFWAASANNNRDEIHRQLVQNDPADDLEFWLADYDIANCGASSRSYYVVNTPRQARLKIPQCYQVADIESYREVFDRWKQAGFVGSITQGIDANFSDPHLLCDTFV